MSNESSKSSPLHCEVTYPRADVALAVRHEVSYSSTPTDRRLMDIYVPLEDGAPRAAMIIASGYPAAGLRHYVGCSPRALASITSWAQLLASEGLAVITYDAVEPTTDLHSVLALLRAEGARLGIDSNRLGVLACSGNAPVALAAVAAGGLQCAVLLYPFSLDGSDSSTVEAASRQFGFANPTAELTADDLPATTSLMLVRAGKDAFPGLNATLDHFTANALRSNLPITVINHATAPHAFDLIDASRESHDVIRRVLEFARSQLAGDHASL